MNDDDLDDDRLYVRPEFRADEDEHDDSHEDVAPHLEVDRVKRLRSIAADPNESYSDRMDAQRLLESVRPRDFDREFTDLVSRRRAS